MVKMKVWGSAKGKKILPAEETPEGEEAHFGSGAGEPADR